MRFVDASRVRTRFHEAIVMRDGIALSVDLYLPAGDGPHPVLLTRTPYDNNRAVRPRADGSAPGEAPAQRWRRLAACGYVVAAADVRGRGDSEGVFEPFSNEARDGADTVAWARTLAEGDGQVGAFGAGYAGYCALAAAAASRAVDALHVVSPFGAPDQGMPFRDGVLRLDWLFWMHLVGGRTTQPTDLPRWEQIWRALPVRELDAALGREDIWWRAWLDDPNQALRAPGELAALMTSLQAPTQLVTGWWDQGLPAARAWWDALGAADDALRREVIVGPWDTRSARHPRAEVGGIDWGPSSVVDPDELLLGWFDEYLKGHPRTTPGATARLFITGTNAWRDMDVWSGEHPTHPLWLSSHGAANTRRGNGVLGVAPPGDDVPPDAFVYDPANPVPWHPRSERFSHPESSLRLDDGHITSRDDALVYTAPAVDHTIVLLGRPRLTLFAQTDAPDADWIALLADVFPGGGRTVHLAHTVVRAAAQPHFAIDAPVRYELTFDDIGHALLPGHALRLTITSSLFPLYARNLGGEQPYLEATRGRRALQRVLHDRAHPSVLTLPTERS